MKSIGGIVDKQRKYDKEIIKSMQDHNACIYFRSKHDHDLFINKFFVKERKKGEHFTSYAMKGIQVMYGDGSIQGLLMLKHSIESSLKEYF